MSKESLVAFECPRGCGGHYAHMEYHLPHCLGESAHPRNRFAMPRKVVDRAEEIIERVSGIFESRAKAEETQSRRRVSRKQKARKRA